MLCVLSQHTHATLSSQQAIIEEIRLEQRVLTAAVASFSQSQTQDPRDDSVTLSPPNIRETLQSVTYATTPERSGTSSTTLVPKRPASRWPPKHVSSAPSNTHSVAQASSSTTTGDTWKIPECYAKTQRGGGLRRHGAFYDTPDWHAMTVAAGGVPDSGAPALSPPVKHRTQGEIITALRNARAEVNRKLEARQKKTGAAASSEKAAMRDDGDAAPDSASDASPRSSSKRSREPDEQEAKKTSNPMDISSIVHDAPDGDSPLTLSPSSSGHYPVPDDAPNGDGPTKRRRLSTGVVESPPVPERIRPTRRSSRREN
jgi:hypothetical protein